MKTNTPVNKTISLSMMIALGQMMARGARVSTQQNSTPTSCSLQRERLDRK